MCSLSNLIIACNHWLLFSNAFQSALEHLFDILRYINTLLLLLPTGLTVTEKCYTELYPKEDIVYLTPNSQYNMEDYDHDAVYIIGGNINNS